VQGRRIHPQHERGVKLQHVHHRLPIQSQDDFLDFQPRPSGGSPNALQRGEKSRFVICLLIFFRASAALRTIL